MLRFRFLSRSQNERDGLRARKKCRPNGFSAGGHPPDVGGGDSSWSGYAGEFPLHPLLRLSNRSGKFLRAGLSPCQGSFRLPSRRPGGQTISTKPNARESRLVFLWVYALSECLPHHSKRFGESFSGAAREGSRQSASPFREHRSAPRQAGDNEKLYSLFQRLLYRTDRDGRSSRRGREGVWRLLRDRS